jgi:hypothetical protein
VPVTGLLKRGLRMTKEPSSCIHAYYFNKFNGLFIIDAEFLILIVAAEIIRYKSKDLAKYEEKAGSVNGK